MVKIIIILIALSAIGKVVNFILPIELADKIKINNYFLVFDIVLMIIALLNLIMSI